MYPGQHMSIEDNIFYAKRNIVDSIWKEANIEGIDITFPATKAVFEGAKIANLTQDQTTVINNLKHGWQFIFDFIDAPIDLSYVRQLSELFNETGSKLNGTLKSLIKENILNRAYHNVYVFRFSQYGGLGTLDLIGKKIRPNDSFYESLESSASAWSLISQIPTVVTYMTTGKSKWYNTGYGSIDFVHYSKTDEKPRTIDRSSMGRVPLADKLQTYRDLQKTKRSLDLLREQYDKDHGCRDGNIQYYPCEDDDTWDFLDNLEEDIL